MDAKPSIDTVRVNVAAGTKQLGRRLTRFLQKLPLITTHIGDLGPLWFMTAKKTIICVDDIERRGRQLSIRELLGQIALLKEQKKCKVVLILNDEALEDDETEFNMYYEKVVDVSLSFAPTAEECVVIALSPKTSGEEILKRRTIRAFLNGVGWPAPIVGDSGNGGHLLYRLPELDLKRAGDLVKQCLRALSSRFSDELAKVDESTANAARLCRLYGTMTRKGDSTPGRPHRRSALLELPDRVEPVSTEALEALASKIPAAVSAVTGTKAAVRAPGAFNIDGWLQSSGLEIIKGPDAYNGGRRWTLRNCPFNPDHQKPVVIELPNGALAYTCLHQSCSENNWQALRGHVEPDYQKSSKVFPVASVRSESTNDLPTITDLSQIPSVFSIESQLDWSVEGMIARGSVTLICAESGTGKTWFGYYVAGCVALGAPVLGRSTTPSKVLYLDGENPLYVVKQRLRDLRIQDTPLLTVWGGWIPMLPVGPNHFLVIDFARQHKGLIVFDSLIEFHTGSEQSSTETRAFMRYFRLLANLGATVVILHHTGKAESSKLYRGSSDIKAAVDTAYVLARASQKPDELGALSMNCFKARLAPGQHFGMQFQKGCGFIPSDAFETAKTVVDIITEILEATPNRNQSEIVQLAQQKGSSKGQIEVCLKTGPWSKQSGPKNSTLYSLRTVGLDDH